MTTRRLRFTLPDRLRHPYIRASRVTAVQCTSCRQWVKPRYLRVPACICRHCEAIGANQTWKPSAAHLKRAHEAAAREQSRYGRTRDDVTLAGR